MSIAQKVFIQSGNDSYKTAKKILEKINFSVRNKKVLIKPNLTFPSESKSVNTDVGVVKAVIEKLKDCDTLVGDGGYDTEKTFELCGYDSLQDEFGVKLIDLNKDEIIRKKIPKPFAFREIPFAKSAFGCDYIINIGKLKIHSLAKATLCIKNLFGLVVPRRNRVIIHPFINKALADIVQVVKPDFNIIDGIVGNQIDEVRADPVSSGIVLASEDALSLDIVGCKCMGLEQQQVEYLALIEKLLGERKIETFGEEINRIAKPYKTKALLSTKLRYFGERMLGRIYRLQ